MHICKTIYLNRPLAVDNGVSAHAQCIPAVGGANRASAVDDVFLRMRNDIYDSQSEGPARPNRASAVDDVVSAHAQ